MSVWSPLRTGAASAARDVARARPWDGKAHRCRGRPDGGVVRAAAARARGLRRIIALNVHRVALSIHSIAS
eukprot:2231682-Pyramimonas_sp.AAC.1